MHVQINRGHGIDGNLLLAAHVEAVVRRLLRHLEEHLTRVVVHLDDENGGKTGIGDRSCTMEVRPRHHWPMVVSHRFGDVHQVVDGAARKLRSSLEHVFERLEDIHRGSQIRDGNSLQASALAPRWRTVPAGSTASEQAPHRVRPIPASRTTGHDASTGGAADVRRSPNTT